MHSTKYKKSWYKLYIFFFTDSLRVGGKVGHSAEDNDTDEAKACTCDDAETGISMADDNFPDDTLTVAVVILLSCLYTPSTLWCK